MPEGPEIRIAADKVGKALVNRTTTQVFFAFDALKPFESRLTGLEVLAVESRGKAMLTFFEGGWVIYSHNQLYGLWMISPSARLPNTKRQLRLALHNRHHSALLYSASDIQVLRADQLDQHQFLSKLGPDCLSDTLSARQIIDRLQCPEFKNRQLASLLLDQSFIAGLGNYLRAEILYFAGLRPATKPADCSATQLQRLAKLMITLCKRSYRTGGVINPPALVNRLRSMGKTKKSQYRFSVYKREGQSCYQCGERVASKLSGGRTIYYCPGCQSA